MTDESPTDESPTDESPTDESPTDESPTDESPTHDEPVTVAVYADRGEAEVAHAKLRSFGIDAALLDEAEGGALPVGDDQGVRVQVRAEDADDARAALAERADS